MPRLGNILFLAAGVIAGLAAHGAEPDAGAAFPRGEATEFARVTHDRAGRPEALQIAIARYVPASGDRDLTVDLIGAVHVGDKGYYAELNQRFKDYDAVLFELIAPEGARELIQDSTTHHRGIVSGAQLLMTKALGLSFQLEEIDYGAANLVHADLSPGELSKSMAERGESLYVYFWRMFYASINEAAKDPLGIRAWRNMNAALDSERSNPLKLAFAYEMTNIEAVSSALDGAAGSAVIDARNQRAVDVLGKQIGVGKRRIGIFYGVAHMPDLEERLVEQLGLRYHDTRWVNAWRLDAPADVGSAAADEPE